jgi:long-chain acyl-CoA synthetase
VSASLRPDKTAVVDHDRTLTFQDLNERVNRVTNAVMHGLGLPPGVRVGILAPNCIEYVELVLGLAAAGMPPVLLNSRLSPTELAQIAEDCAVGAVFVHPDLRHLLDRLGTAARHRSCVIGPEYEAWLARADSRETDVGATGEKLFCIAPTGGTTGRSKGVRLSQQSRVLMYLMMGSVFGCYSNEDVNLTVSPLFHGAGFNFCFATLFFGGTVVLSSGFDPENVLSLMSSERITNAAVVPTHLAGLFALGERRIRDAGPGNLRALISNGAPLPVSMKQLANELWGENTLFEAYGGTEAGIISTMAPRHLMERPTSVGQIFPGNFAEIRAESGLPAPPGVVGELYTRSPYLFSGYEGGRSSGMSKDGWFSAGDLGHLDPDGFLFLVDRKEDKIISGGVNIYPAEVELAIADHPAVNEVAVFGVPDAYWGESVHALVALSPGAEASSEELKAFAEIRLGRMKIPKTLEFRESLPKSAAGKVLRRVLRDEHRARHSNNGSTSTAPDGLEARPRDVD